MLITTPDVTIPKFMKLASRENTYAIVLCGPTGRVTADFLSQFEKRNITLFHLDSLSSTSGRTGPLSACFSTAAEVGFTHAVVPGDRLAWTTEDLHVLMRAADANPDATIVGYSLSSKSSLFSRLHDVLANLESGRRFHDPRGPRIYPLRLFTLIDPHGQKPWTMMELLVRAAVAGCPIIEIQLNARPPVSQPRWESAPARLRAHVRILLRALNPRHYEKYDASSTEHAHVSVIRALARWLNPLRIWTELRAGGASRFELAAGIAVGVFIGNTPFFFLHTVISLYVARRLHLNPIAVIAGSKVSTPPMSFILTLADMWLGYVILFWKKPHIVDTNPFHGEFRSQALVLIPAWFIGATIIGAAMAALTFAFFSVFLRVFERRTHTEKAI